MLAPFVVGFGACSLTGDYQPESVERVALERDASASSAPDCSTDRDCESNKVCLNRSCEERLSAVDATAPCRGSDCPSSGPMPLVTTCSDGVLSGDEVGIDCGGGTCARCATDAPCIANEDCQSSICASGACAAPSCDDGVANQDEAGADCGGSCESRCAEGVVCRADADCNAGLLCSLSARACTPISCSDGVRNGTEIGVDCGGGGCEGCLDGSECAANGDCASRVCTRGSCAAPECNDGVQNQDESDVDCGGRCARDCGVSQRCLDDGDCQTGVCGEAGCDNSDGNCCQPPACDDGIRNGTEVGVDCGNAACGPCPLGSFCTADAQCELLFCQQGQCRNPGSCTDLIRNGRETSIDCGGDRCPRCVDLLRCGQDSDCVNRNCDLRGVCISCGDGVQDGTETSIDCGGADPACRRCNAGEGCNSNEDCNGLLCLSAICG